MAAKPAPPQVDLSEFEALSRPRRTKCGVHRALEVLKGSERRQFEAALAIGPDTIAHTAIQAWLTKREIKVGADAIRRHRRKACSCDA